MADVAKAGEEVAKETDRLEIDSLKDREAPLSATEEAKMRATILEDLDAEESQPKKKVGSTSDAEDSDVKEEEPVKKEEEAPPEKKSDVKPEDKKEGEESGDDEDKTPEQLFEKQIKDYAEEHKIPEYEARKDIDSIKAINEKHLSDPSKLAKSVLHAQRLASKSEEKLKAFEEQIKARSVQNQIPSLSVYEENIANGKVRDGKGNALEEDQVFELYKKDHEEAEDLTDDQLRKFVAREMRDYDRQHIQTQLVKRSEDASTIKTNLLNELAKTDDGAFIDDIKKGLAKYPDNIILRKGFSLNEMLRWARGGKAYEEMKKTNKELEAKILDAKKEGVKRGREEVEIIGEVGASTIGKGAAGGKSTTGLSKGQQTRALKMYDAMTDVSNEDKFKMFKEDGFDKDDY